MTTPLETFLADKKRERRTAAREKLSLTQQRQALAWSMVIEGRDSPIRQAVGGWTYSILETANHAQTAATQVTRMRSACLTIEQAGLELPAKWAQARALAKRLQGAGD